MTEDAYTEAEIKREIAQLRAVYGEPDPRNVMFRNEDALRQIATDRVSRRIRHHIGVVVR